MPVYSRGRFSGLFVHIPKTGGHYIESSMRRLGWTERLAVQGLGLKAQPHLRIAPQHYHRDLLEEILKPDAFDFSFTVCRHPYDRLKSEYYWQIHQGLATERDPVMWWSQITSSFMLDQSIHDNHIRFQTHYLLRNDGFRVFRFEDDGISKALSFCMQFGDIGPIRRALIKLWPPRTHSSIPDPELESAFRSIRPSIEAFYKQDMDALGY